ncbi:hypothetical protein DRN86_03850 [Candidatus Geothermarchaeota archaeon]|nr:MAG: hypothetical protein DRN86_03850 [Candidatus Geothermarchaeota archaeon]
MGAGISFLRPRKSQPEVKEEESARGFFVTTMRAFKAAFDGNTPHQLIHLAREAGAPFVGWREVKKAAHFPLLVVNAIGVPVCVMTISLGSDKGYLVARSREYGSLYAVEIKKSDAQNIINKIKAIAITTQVPIPIATQVTQTARVVSQSQSQVKAKEVKRALKRSRKVKNKAKKIAQSNLSVKEKIISIINLEGEILRDELIALLPHNKAHIGRTIKRLIEQNKIAAVETDEGLLLVSTEKEE